MQVRKPLSRVRGGMPKTTAPPRRGEPSLPRTRGYAALKGPLPAGTYLSPAYAGVCPTSRSPPRCSPTLSRVRGGMPRTPPRWPHVSSSLPRTRGYAGPCLAGRVDDGLSPAYAGVCPAPACRGCGPSSLSRVRGGMPEGWRLLTEATASLPRTRGYASPLVNAKDDPGLSPAYAGVCPCTHEHHTPPRPSLPRTRGYAQGELSMAHVAFLSPAYAGVCPGLPMWSC